MAKYSPEDSAFKPASMIRERRACIDMFKRRDENKKILIKKKIARDGRYEAKDYRVAMFFTFVLYTTAVAYEARTRLGGYDVLRERLSLSEKFRATPLPRNSEKRSLSDARRGRVFLPNVKRAKTRKHKSLLRLLTRFLLASTLTNEQFRLSQAHSIIVMAGCVCTGLKFIARFNRAVESRLCIATYMNYIFNDFIRHSLLSIYIYMNI